jgi:putative transposase/transposase-like zinc-binding protein
MIELAEVVKKHGPEYLEKFGERMPNSHKRALFAITACRTEAMGGHLEECDKQCGNFEYAYHSCKNGSCPKCHGADTKRWLEKRETELLPVPYFHLVFTLPAELREIVRSNQKALYAVLFEAAIAALNKLGLDRKYIGGQLGMLTVLHTWTRAKEYHPHLHLLVPAGGLDKDGVWRPARRKFLVPVRALSPIFRAIFMKLAKKALPKENFPKEVWDKNWVVFSRPTFKKTKKVLSYLARYVHRVAITNNSIIAMENDHVTFRYQNSTTRQWKTMPLPAMEFLRRFLQHVLPKGFHKVRYYGFLHPVKKVTLKRLQLLLTERDRHRTAELEQEIASRTEIVKICHCCKVGIMVVVARLPRKSRSPPA